MTEKTQATPKARRNLKSLFLELFPETGASATIDQLVTAFGSKEEVRRILSTYGSPALSPRSFVALKFIPATGTDPAHYLRIEQTPEQTAEIAHWESILRPVKAAEKTVQKLVVFEKLPDGNLRLVEVDAPTAEKLIAFSEEVKARAA